MIASYDFIAALLTSKIKNERAASLVEYALLVALIAAVCIVAVKAFGQNAKATFNTAASQVTVTAP